MNKYNISKFNMYNSLLKSQTPPSGCFMELRKIHIPKNIFTIGSHTMKIFWKLQLSYAVILNLNVIT